MFVEGMIVTIVIGQVLSPLPWRVFQSSTTLSLGVKPFPDTESKPPLTQLGTMWVFTLEHPPGIPVCTPSTVMAMPRG